MSRENSSPVFGIYPVVMSETRFLCRIPVLSVAARATCEKQPEDDDDPPGRTMAGQYAKLSAVKSNELFIICELRIYIDLLNISSRRNTHIIIQFNHERHHISANCIWNPTPRAPFQFLRRLACLSSFTFRLPLPHTEERGGR